MQNSSQNRLPAVLIIIAAVLTVAAIIFFKSSTPKPVGSDSGNSKSSGPVAVPDTSLAKDAAIPTPADTFAAAPTDSIGRDRRPADEAGAEDGYWAGYYDGVDGVERAENDLVSTFPSARERQAYADNYKEGYARGYEEGRASRRK